jgi:uncharacterized membrane protein
MRKFLEVLSLAGLAGIFGFTWLAFNGPEPLPARVPTHFDAAGNANAWAPPSTLWFLPVIGVALYLFITLISLLPTRIRSAANLSPESRARMEALTHQMVAWIKLELICLFAWIQWSILQFVRQGEGSLPPIAVPIFIATILVTLGLHTVAITGAVRDGAGS